MFNFTDFLKDFNSSIRWNTRIKSYITKQKKFKEFDKHSKFYSCSVESAIDFTESLETVDEVMKEQIKNALLNRRILELKNEVARVENLKVKRTLEIEHLNIYNIKNMEELAKRIVSEIDKSTIENIRYIFTDYVYCFTYKYSYNYIKTNLVTIRNAIKSSSLPDDKKAEALDVFRFSARVHNYLSHGASTQREQNMTKTLDTMNMTFLDEFASEAKEYIKKDVPRHETKKAFTYLSVLLALATGRRLTELATQASIEAVSRYKIKVVGLGKKRTEDAVEVIIPTLLLSAKEVVEAFAKMKTFIPKGIKSQRQQDKFAHNLVDFHLIDSRLWDKKHKFSNLRAIYAISCELIYNQNNINEENKKPQATYFQLVLGHSEFDFETCQHYFKRQILIKGFDLKAYLSKSKSAMM